MTKFREFIKGINLLNEHEFEAISSKVKFSVHFSPFIELIIEPISPLPIDIFLKIQEFQIQRGSEIKISFLGKIKEFTLLEINEYIDFFLNNRLLDQVLIQNLLKRNPIIIDKTGVIIFTYITTAELNELKSIEENLLTFLNEACFGFSSFEYRKQMDNSDVDNYKNEQLEKAKKLQLKTKSSDFSKVISDNTVSSTKTTKINDLIIDQRSAIIIGEIFSLETINTRTGTKIYKYMITDHSGSLSIRAFPTDATVSTKSSWNRKNLPCKYLESFQPGQWVKVKISISLDQYSGNELSGMIDQIVSIPAPKEFIRTDDLELKRLELVSHTKMSAFDGLCPIGDLIKRTKNYGWNAATIIDRFNVQAYPEAMKYGKIHNQKIIYGVEVDVLNEIIPIVVNPQDISLKTAEYVVFDLETTGLFNEFDEIIEFGAIKIKNNTIIDRVDIFIKPTNPIPPHIQQLTHITNDMVKNAELIKPSLEKIVKWIGSAVLIAHNGINFDLRFLNKKLEQENLPQITNPLIDTMQLSRTINKELFQHNLGYISRKMYIEYNDEEAHRADFDAEVLYQVWKVFVEKLKSLNITNLNEINSLQSEELYTRQFSQFMQVYCKNQSGIKDIYKLVSYAHTKNLYKNPRVFKEYLNANRNNFLIANSPTEGDVWDTALNGTSHELEKIINFFDYIFIPSPRNWLHEIERQNISEENVKKTILKIINTSQKLSKPVIAVSDAYYLDPWDKIAHHVYVHTKMLGGKPHRLYRYGNANQIVPDLHLRTTSEMFEEFSFIKDKKLLNEIIVENSQKFNEQISSDIKPLRDKLCPPKIPGVEKQLEELVYFNAKSKYGEILPDIVQQRVKKELDAIIRNNFAVVYWISHLLVKQSLQDGYLVGSRGSVGSSIVAHFANISEVNPLPPHYICKKCQHSNFEIDGVADGFDLPKSMCPKCGEILSGDGHNIPFETFLGFECNKVPDIDLNFSGEYQSKAHDFIKSMFGEDHTFRAGTISTVADKTAFGYVKNYYEQTKPNDQVKQSDINWIVKKCVDVKRTTGQHPGGIIIVPKEMDIFDFSPYNFPADDKSLAWFTSHFAFEYLHDTLLKFDILGHDDPTSLKMLEELTGVNPISIPFQDPEVMALFNSLSSLKLQDNELLKEKVAAFGLPEFGTEFVRKILTTTQPQCFADLIRVSGLSHGTDVYLNNAADLISKSGLKLSEVIACRDDIMVYLIEKGLDPKVAFTIMENVRKGKPLSSYEIEQMKSKSVPQWYIDSCTKIKYLFPKAHATAYAIMAWRIAWFKVHHPLAFYATYFSIRPDVFDIKTILEGQLSLQEKIKDIKSRLNSQLTKKSVKQKEKDLIPVYELALEMNLRGFKVANIDLQKSHASKFILEGNTLIPPFGIIDGLGEVAANSIAQARSEKMFTSKEDLTLRTKLNKTNIAFLESLGVLKELEDNSQMSLF